LVVYGIVLLMLLIMCFYVSRELLSVATSLDALNFKPHWPIEPAHAIDILILGLSTSLLLLAWLNAAWIVLIALFAIVAALVILLVGCVILAWRTIIFKPVRFVLRGVYHLATWIRERGRDRILAQDMADYTKRREAPDDERMADYQSRVKLFEAAKNFRSRAWAIQKDFGYGILDGGRSGFELGSEWMNVSNLYGLIDMSMCATFLMILAERAPIKLVTSDASHLYEELEGVAEAYSRSTVDALLAVIARSSGSAERSEAVRTRNAGITPRGKQIRRLRERWQLELTKLTAGEAVMHHAKVDISELTKAAERYFGETHSPATAFSEAAPIRGARDSRLVTYLFGILGRAANV
jgi:hypothetical protein